MEDLGWMCVKAWRFGSSQPVAGVGEYEQLFDAYAAAGGGTVDPDVVRWWEVLGTMKWGIMCIMQANAHLTGVAPQPRAGGDRSSRLRERARPVPCPGGPLVRPHDVPSTRRARRGGPRMAAERRAGCDRGPAAISHPCCDQRLVDRRTRTRLGPTHDGARSIACDRWESPTTPTGRSNQIWRARRSIGRGTGSGVAVGARQAGSGQPAVPGVIVTRLIVTG